MKLVLVLSVIAYGYAAKLDRTYLPPASAGTAGGSPGSISAPLGGHSAGFGQPSSSGFGQSPVSEFGQSSGPALGQPSSAGQAGQLGSSGVGNSLRPSFGQQGFGQPASAFGQPSGSGSYGPAKQSYTQSAGPVGQDAQPFGQPPSAFGAQGGQGNLGAQGPFGQSYNQPERPQAAADRNAEMLSYDNQNDGETFSYSFETSNGISADESGVATNGVQAEGGFAYTGDDGQVYSIRYTADENGYQPQGDHLPTPPPIPDEILRSIEENERAAAAGTQEGAYRPEEYESSSPQQYNAGASPSYNNQPQDGKVNQFGSPVYQPQGQSQSSNQQYGAPNSGVAGFANNKVPSSQLGQYNQGPRGGISQGPQGQVGSGQQGFSGKPNQGNRPQGGQSGYEYDRPQTFGNQNRPSQLQSQQYNKPVSQFGSQGSSGPQGQSGSQGQFGSQGSSGPQGDFRSQGAFGPQKPSVSQGSSGPHGSGSQGSAGYRPSASQAPSRPQGFSGPQGSTGYRPSSSQGPSGSQSSFNYRPSTGQGPTGPQGSSGYQGSSGPQGAAGPQGNLPSFPGPRGHPGSSPQNQYGPPSTQGSSSAGFPQSGPNKPINQGRPGQAFGGPRQPPSFSPEEGYKY